MVARPKNDTKPMTSVMVVSTTPPARAGSILMRFRTRGIVAPASAAAMRLMIIADAINKPSDT